MPPSKPSASSSTSSSTMIHGHTGHSLAEMNQIAANNNNNNSNNKMIMANKHTSNNITTNQNNNSNMMTNHNNSGSLIKSSSSKSQLNVRLSSRDRSQQHQQQHPNHKPDITSLQPEVREYLFKILVIGELGTGKTSFIKRYVHQYFSQYYRATIGVDFALKVLNWDDNILIRLQLWDIAGQERFGNMTRIYYKEAVGAFLVFDVSAPASFNAVLKWKHDLDTKVCMADGEPIPCLLLANKCDANKEGIAADPEMLDKFVRENNFCGWFYTSAKENINIEESAKFLVGKILQRQKHLALEDELENNDVINLAYNNHGVSKSSKCSC